MFRLLVALLLLAIRASTTHAQVTSGASIIASSCPSGSINYITHSLPQQCLTTSWTSKANQRTPTKKEVQTSGGSATSPASTQNSITATSTLQLAPVIEPSNDSYTLSSQINSPSSAVEALKEPGAALEADQEGDSPLDNANFLSFEDWKRQNLAKAGQSAENLGARTGGGEPRRRPGGINNALDSLGEDTEIEIDFGGFVNAGSSVPTPSSAKSSTEKDGSTAKDEFTDSTAAAEEPSGVRRKGKDAGKTCKERSNYASFDCAATVLKTNPESKGSTAVLVENKDSYMLNTCSAKNKFFIVELCDDILIDTVVLANFEFFSSMFRTFRISVSDRYPVKLEKWKEIGTFEARNSREVQAFLVENPLIWARYIRVEILTHYGNEYYCPVSLLRVHGTTMMEEFNHDLKRSGTEDENDNESGENEDTGPVAGVIIAEALKVQAQHISKQAEGTSARLPSAAPIATVGDPSSQPISDMADIAVQSLRDPVLTDSFAPYNFSISKQMEDMLSALGDGYESCRPQDKPPGIAESATIPSESPPVYQSTISSTVGHATIPAISQVSAQTSHALVTKETNLAEGSLAPISEDSSSADKTEQARLVDQATASAVKVPISSTQPPNANPTTQESFFKSVHKRLQLLESNSTLSLQYIEEQSRILRDAFSKVEKRQLAKTTTFLETLNNTVLTELRDFRNQYDQIWQSTVLELSSQREQSQHEVLALSARLSLLADEIVLQKRIAILQFLLILLCLGLAIFSCSGSRATHSELTPLINNAINKSPGKLSRYVSHFETPPTSPSSTRPSSRHGLMRGFTQRRSPSEDPQQGGTRDRMKSPSVEYFPLTPNSRGSHAKHNDLVAKTECEETLNDGSPQAKADGLRQTKSSPASPTGQSEEESEFVERQYLRLDTGGEAQPHRG